MYFKLIKAFIKHNLRFYLLLVLCTGICFSAYVTFHTVQTSIDRGLHAYLNEYEYYDGLLQPYYGTFLPGDADAVRAVDGVRDVIGAYCVDTVLTDDSTKCLRLIGVDPAHHSAYVLDESDVGNIGLSAEFAEYMGIRAGDHIEVRLNGTAVDFTVKDIINDPELMGATRSIGPALEISSLGYAYISNEVLGKYTDVTLPNTIAYYLEENADPEKTAEKVNEIFDGRQIYCEEGQNRHAVQSVRNDLAALRPIAAVLPVVMYLIGLVISVLFLRQFIEIKVRDIGILHSNGVSHGGVLGIFIGYALSVAVSASVFGILLSVIQSRIYTDFYSNAVYLPSFDVKVDVGIIAIATCLTALITVAAVFVNIRQITNVDIIEIMNAGAVPKQAAMKFLHNRFIELKPFLAPIFGKWASFLFSLVNMVLVCVIVTASLGVRDAKDNSIAFLYDKEVNYDYALHYYSYAPRENNGDNTYREFYAEINGKYSKLYAMNNTDYVHIYDETDRPLELGNGIILYSKLAEELGVEAGDSVTVDGKKVTVDAVCKAVTDYKCYLSCEAYEELYGDSGCNALFVQGELPEYDDGPDSGFFYVGSVGSLQHDLESKFAYISSYILIIIGISCLICVIVIYNLSVIFYRRRIRDHMILRTLGNSYSKVLAGSLIEIILQAILALAIGIPLGYELAAYTVHAISNDAITMYISFGDIPVVTISAFILITAIVGRIVAAPGQIRLLPKEN